MVRSKGLINRNGWTKGDLRGCGRSGGLQADLSTEQCFVVDLSPGREAGLWITPVGGDNLQVGLIETDRRRCRLLPEPCAQNRPSWQRASQSEAAANSPSDVPARGARTSWGLTSARG